MTKSFKPATKVKNGIMKKRFKATVDRIENGIVILIPADDGDLTKVAVPLRFMPENVKESDVITVRMAIDTEETETAKKRVAEMVKKLTS